MCRLVTLQRLEAGLVFRLNFPEEDVSGLREATLEGAPSFSGRDVQGRLFVHAAGANELWPNPEAAG